jgi:hypothetical protein
MDRPPSKIKQEYTDEIRVIEANIKDFANGTAPTELYKYNQEKLDKLAERYQNNEQLGTARYKLYELQALIYYFQNKDDEALDFINHAIDVKGASYKRAEQLIETIKSEPAEPLNISRTNTVNTTNQKIPLELQFLIKSYKTNAIIMGVISILTFYFIPFAVFYFIIASKIKPEELPNRNQLKWAAILGLPLSLGLIPLLVDIEFWRLNRKLKEFDKKGPEAFKSDEEFLAGEPKRKKRSRRALIVLLSITAIFVVLIVVAIVSSSSDTNTDSGSFLNSESVTPYTSAQHGFTVSFPGFPTTEKSNIDVEGVSVPYTYYSKEIDNGNKFYATQVVEYPASDFDFTGQERGSLDGSINGMAQGEGITLVTSSNNATFLGYPSASATFKASSDGQTYDMYTVNFLKGNNLYVLMTAGETKASFDNFVSSFRLN